MAAYNLIATTTVDSPSGAASIAFSSIPQTYTDLKIVLSVRSTSAATALDVGFNGSTASFTNKYLQGSGSAVSSGSLARYAGLVTGTDQTAIVFANCEIYIPNYSGSTNKSFSGDAVQENNATSSYASIVANLWSNTAAITQITFTNATGNLAQYSSASLYGIKNS
jgi:hypothetical protein